METLPSGDKQNYYDFIADWADKGDSLNEFNITVDVLDGTGNLIQTWDFQNCEIIGYATYLQDSTFIYQHSRVQDSEFGIGPIFHTPVFRSLLLNPVLASFFNTKKPRIIENHETFS